MICVLFLSLSFSGHLMAEKKTDDFSAKDFTFNHTSYQGVLYDNSNGLPTSEANSVVQSSDGFIYIGGYSGLIRYDGVEFYRFPSSDGLASVICLYVDEKDRLLVGTNDSGLAIYDDHNFTFFTRDEGLENLSIRAICEDDNHNIIIGTGMGLAYLDKEDKIHLVQDDRIDSKEIIKLEKDVKGDIYAVSKDGDVYVISSLKISRYIDHSEFKDRLIISAYPDPNNEGYVYLGTEGNEILYGKIDEITENYQSISTGIHQKINEMKMINSNIWVCTNNGIGYLDSDYNYIELEDVPMSNWIDHMIVDFEGNLWFTSQRQGLMKVVENRFTDINGLADLDAMVVNSTYKYGDDLYIATETGLLILDNDYQLKNNKVSELLKNERIRSIIPDSKGNLWFSSNGEQGLICYDPEEDEYVSYTPDNGLASKKPRMVCERSDGSLAVATNAGVNIIKDGQVISTLGKDQGINNDKILSIVEGSDGRLYLGTDGDGIYVWDGNVAEHISLDDGLKSEVIMRLKRDPYNKNIIWAVTSNSLAYLDDGKVTTINNFPYSNNFDLYFDSSGKIWVLSGNGIYVVSRDEMLKNEEIQYVFYNGSNGLPCITTANSYSHLLDDGTLYISGSTGVAKLNINDALANETVLNFQIPWVSVDDKLIDVDEDNTIHIPSNCRRLTIHAYAFTYSLSNPYISYYLEGFDDKETITTRDKFSEVSYTNLDGKTYKFHLSQIDISTGETKNSIELTIIKEKAIYESVWFFILAALALAGFVALLVMSYFRVKTRRLEEKEKANRKLIDEICNVFAKTIDMKDRYTNGHSVRVAAYSKMLAEKMGLDEETVNHIHNIALLHDIGKIAIPDAILNKPEALSNEEFEVMKTHAQKGYELLKEISIAPDLAIGAGYHHEKMDGSGYPNHLKKEEIPEIAQIIAVADTFDAMHSTRPYRKGMKLSDIAKEMKRVKGTQLNEKAVEALLELIAEGKFNDNR